MLENGQMATLNMKDVLPNRFQPRIHFNEIKLNELAESIRKYGLIQPIVVRQIGSKYEIIAGERRFKASILANKETIPAIVVTLSDRDSEEIALLENIQREDLTAIEEAVSYKRILDTGYITQEELAKKIGKPQSVIANKIRLLNLDDNVQDALLHGKISERHARSLLKIKTNDLQVEMLNRIINERLTVKMTDHAIASLLENLEKSNIADKDSLEKNNNQIRRAVPVASHKIIRVNPPKELENKILQKNNEKEGDSMDIDKILEEAQDITPQENTKPANDIENLMKQDSNTIVSPLIKSETEEVKEPEIQSGKFVMPVQQNDDNQDNKQPAPPQSSITFDSIFNQTPTTMNSEVPASETPTTPAIESEPAPVVPDANTPAEAPTAVPEAPIIPNIESNPAPVVPDANTPAEAPTAVPEAPIMPNIESNPAPVVPDANTPAETPAAVPEAPIMPNIESEPVPVVPDANTPAETPAVVPEAPIMPTIEAQNVNPNNIFNTEPAQLNPVQMEPIQAMPNSENDVFNMGVQLEQPSVAAMNIPDDSIIEETPQVNNSGQGVVSQNQNVANFKNVINLIRNCASEIEKLGYYIDVDEVNLDQKYLVTFKINK